MKKINIVPIPAKLIINAKQDILMPYYKAAGKRYMIPKGTPFIWSSRTNSYVCRIDGRIVSSVDTKYVEKVNIFE